MTGNVRQTPPEPTCGTLWVTSDNSPTFDGTGPQNAPEGTVDMNSIDNLREYVLTAPSICSTTRAILVGYIDEIEREAADMVPLPVDADGEPWHINDEFEVDEGIAHVNGIGDNRLYYIDNDGMQWTRADNKRHHHAPTVEDVLREFFSRYVTTKPKDEDDAILAEYAAKLRLAGDE